MYVSPDGESITELGKSTDKLKGKDNYRNCVVALKRSWSFKVSKFMILVILQKLRHSKIVHNIIICCHSNVFKNRWIYFDNNELSGNFKHHYFFIDKYIYYKPLVKSKLS